MKPCDCIAALVKCMQLLLQQAVALQHGHHDLLPHPVVPIILLGLLPANKTIFVNVL